MINPSNPRNLGYLYIIHTCASVAIMAAKDTEPNDFMLKDCAEKLGLLPSSYPQYWKDCNPENLKNINFEECKEYLKKKLDL